MTRIIKFTLLSFFVLGNIQVLSQGVTKVKGVVLEDKSGQPMAFVNVFFKGTNVGASTDLDGNFNIQSRFVSDSLCANFLGYTEVCFHISKEERTRNIEFRLKEKALRILYKPSPVYPRDQGSP